MEQGIFKEADFVRLKVKQVPKFIKIIEEITLEIMDASINHYEFYSFTALAVASSVIACVRKFTGCENIWPEWMQSQTGYSWEGLK